ncbi:MAG: SufD family Fe-S cluster assembly protein, partial [bacterium]|nr:SufD family Fe-S cluster assembly protein [bacterium]
MLGAKAGRVAITGKAEGEGTYLEHDGILVAGDEQRFKLIAELDHHGRHTEGLMRYKGILKDKSYSDLDGLIRVGRNAAKSSSRLEEHTLLLSEQARCDALPALDIQTNDVQVSHSASVSQADSERIFYLMSRGLSKDQARQLLVEGFFENILQVIQNPAWYEQVKALIEAKLSQTPSV